MTAHHLRSFKAFVLQIANCFSELRGQPSRSIHRLSMRIPMRTAAAIVYAFIGTASVQGSQGGIDPWLIAASRMAPAADSARMAVAVFDFQFEGDGFAVQVEFFHGVVDGAGEASHDFLLLAVSFIFTACSNDTFLFFT